MRSKRRPFGVDLFAGAGGMSLGFEQAGFDVAAAVEYDPVHSAVHEFNFPDCATICRSVADIDAAHIRRVSRMGDAPVDVVFGGAPCQGFSMIGKRALDDPRNSLVYHFVRLVVELRANHFVFENVRGLTIGEHKRFLEEIIDEFRRNGYSVLGDYRVLNSARYGVPQDRQRLFLLGARKGRPLPQYPEPTHEPSAPRKRKSGSLFVYPTPTVWDALRDLPEADDFEELLERDWVRSHFKAASAYAAPLRGWQADQGDFSVPREFDAGILRPACEPSTRSCRGKGSRRRAMATPSRLAAFINSTPKASATRSAPEPPAIMARSRRPGQSILFRHDALLSERPHVCIRYPDWFRLHVTKWHGFRQIGNSVPPLLGRAVASKIAEALDGRRTSRRLRYGSATRHCSRSICPKRRRSMAFGPT